MSRQRKLSRRKDILRRPAYYSSIKVAKDLTKFVQQRAFQKAEKLIRNIKHPKCLNGVAGRPSPLTQVLSGMAGYFNLHLAALLVKCGADLNVEDIPISPLEHVIKLYLEAKVLCDKQETSNSKLTIGLYGEINLPPLKLKEQLLELLDMLLASGANPNLVTLHSARMQSTFHKVVAVENPDIDVVMKLCQWGGNLNTGDERGTTPLMDHITKASRDRGFPLIDKILSEGIELDINHTNFNDETMLGRAMLAGSPAIAVRLLRNGADPTMGAHVSGISVSPIFAPLLKSSALYSSLSNRDFSVPGLNKAMLCSVFPVVDCTDICDSVCEDLEYMLSYTDFQMSRLTDEQNCPCDVALLMLGHFKAGLQQLCVRRIMEHVIAKKHGLLNIIAGAFKGIAPTAPGSLMDNMFKAFITDHTLLPLLLKFLNPQIIPILTRDLGLPTGVEPRFHIEAARLQVGAHLFSTHSSSSFYRDRPFSI